MEDVLLNIPERPVPHSIHWSDTFHQSGIRGWNLMKKMGSPKKIVAPMVDQSELAFRLLCRRYGAELCYTPMVNSKIAVENVTYQQTNLDLGCPEDRPLIVQFCGNEPAVMAKAGRLVENKCDAIDINLGCPQNIARRGHYGAFLLDEWDLLQDIVWHMHCTVAIPITCKVRLLDSVEDTITLCRLLVGAGCSMITVHGRTRHQVGCMSGEANWDAIKKIREALPVPVIANGSIGCLDDFEKCLSVTGVAAVMVSEAILSNPAFFVPKELKNAKCTIPNLAYEYLDLARMYPPQRYTAGTIRGHLFKILYSALTRCEDLRPTLASTHSVNEIEAVCKEILQRNEGLLDEDCPFAWYFRHRKHMIPGLGATCPKPLMDTMNPSLKHRKKPIEAPVHDTIAIMAMFGNIE